MNSVSTFVINSFLPKDTLRIAGTLGHSLIGGELIDLIGDLGSGKTEFVRGLAKGIGSTDEVSSPSFTIKNIYHGENDLEIHHYDFYRLTDPGLMQNDIVEVFENPKAVVVVEWGKIVKDVLPPDRLEITIQATGEETREFTFKTIGKRHAKLLEELK